MPIALVNGNFLSSAGSSTAPTRGWATTPVEGNLLVAFVELNGGLQTITAINGWTLIASGADGADGYGALYKVAAPGESTTAAPCTVGASVAWILSIGEFSGTDPVAPFEAVGHTVTATTTKTMVQGTVDPPDGVERLLVARALTDGATRTWSGHKINGSTVGVYAQQGASTGTAAAGMNVTLWCKVENPTVAGAYTAEAICSVADNGSIYLLSFKPGVTTVLTPPLVASGSAVYPPEWRYRNQINATTATATATAQTATLSGDTRLLALTATATAAAQTATITAQRSALFGAATATATAGAQTATVTGTSPKASLGTATLSGTVRLAVVGVTAQNSTATAALRVAVRTTLVGLSATRATVAPRVRPAATAVGRHDTAQPARLAVAVRSAAVGRHGMLAVAALRGQVALRPVAATRAAVALTQLRVRWRAAIAGQPIELPRATNATITLTARARTTLPSGLHAGTGLAAARARSRASLIGQGVRLATASLRSGLRAVALGRLGTRGVARVTTQPASLAVASITRRGIVALRGVSVGLPSEGVHGSLGDLVLTTALRSDGEAVALRQAQTTLVVSASTASAGIRVITIQLPFHPLDVINLGHVYRGDTLTLPIWRATTREGTTIDLTGASLWFTAKTDLSAIDAEAPTIQVSTADGGIVVIDADDGLYQVTLQPNETLGLTGDAVFTFDVQVVTPTPVTRTVRRGTLAVVCDVTRAHA